MKITTDNLIENLPNIGAWSSYSLATEALQFYFPTEYDENGDCKGGTRAEVELCEEIDCDNWQEVIIKYHNEIGYEISEIEVNDN